MEELIIALFGARDYAHLNHLADRQLGKHNALGMFYEGIVGKIDALAEVWMQDRKVFNVPSSINIAPMPPSTYFKSMSDAIDKFAKDSAQRESVRNILAGIQEEFDLALYRLSLDKKYL